MKMHPKRKPVTRKMKAPTDMTHRKEVNDRPITLQVFGPQLKGPEHKEFYVNTNNAQLYHDGSNGTTVGLSTGVIYPLEGIAQGTTNNTRIGDSISCKDVSVRLWLSNKNDRPNVMYRVVAFIAPGNGTRPTVASVISNSSSQYITGFADTATFSILYDKVVNSDMQGTTIVPGVATAKERSYFVDLFIPFKANISYTGTNPAFATLGVHVIAYDAFGSLAADNIASMAITSRVRFTDA
jgi:hypothetical protein